MDYKNEYQDALERARKIHNQTEFDYEKGLIEEIFPELRESEGEKVRKMLIEFFSRGAECNSSTNGIPDKDIIAWLEKHKYTEEDLDKAYKCADEVQYRRGYEDAKKEIEKQGEQKPVDKVEQEYHCNGVREPKEATGVLKQLLNKENYAWSEEDEAYRVDILVKLEPHITDDNFTDVQNWFKSIKDRVQTQSKQEWSEEDKVKINRIVAVLEHLKIANDSHLFKKDIDWLKSLKNKYTWKPSDAQLE